MPCGFQWLCFNYFSRRGSLSWRASFVRFQYNSVPQLLNINAAIKMSAILHVAKAPARLALLSHTESYLRYPRYEMTQNRSAHYIHSGNSVSWISYYLRTEQEYLESLANNYNNVFFQRTLGRRNSAGWTDLIWTYSIYIFSFTINIF